jgi:hypothetical protein
MMLTALFSCFYYYEKQSMHDLAVHAILSTFDAEEAK